jgi:hypothetical protein
VMSKQVDYEEANLQAGEKVGDVGAMQYYEQI